jgi:hypothetical protein
MPIAARTAGGCTSERRAMARGVLVQRMLRTPIRGVLTVKHIR